MIRNNRHTTRLWNTKEFRYNYWLARWSYWAFIFVRPYSLHGHKTGIEGKTAKKLLLFYLLMPDCLRPGHPQKANDREKIADVVFFVIFLIFLWIAFRALILCTA